MEDAVKASSWKPSSPIMAAMSNNTHDAPPGAPDSMNMGMTTPGVAMRALAGQGNTPYWSPSTHAGVGASPSPSGPFGDGPDGGLALTAQEFVPGGGSGAAEFVPGVGVQQASNPSSPQGQQQQQRQQQQGQQGQQQQGQQGQQASSEGVVDGRMYDQHLQEQGGATYSETPLVLPAPKKKTIGSFFMSDRLQERYQHLNECMLRELPPQDAKIKLIPTGYTSIFPLDAPGRDNNSTAGSFGYP